MSHISQLSRSTLSITPERESVVQLSSFQILNSTQMLDKMRLIKNENKMLIMENYVLENYLQKRDPKSLQSMDLFLTTRVQENNKVGVKADVKSPKSSVQEHGLSRLSFRSSGVTIQSRSYFRLNVKQLYSLTQLLNNEVDDDMRKTLTQYHNKIMYFKAKIDSINFNLYELKQANILLTDLLSTSSTTPPLKCISGEKLVYFMKEWIKKAEYLLSKLILRKNSFLAYNRKLTNEINEKKNLSRHTFPIDFEEALINRTELKKKLDKTIKLASNCKHQTAQIGLISKIQNLFLIKQRKELERIKNLQMKNEHKLEKLKQAIELTIIEKDNDFKKLMKLKSFCEKHKNVSVLEYVKKKEELHNIRKELKVSIRQQALLQIQLKRAKLESRKLMRAKRCSSIGRISTFSIRRKPKLIFANIDRQLEELNKITALSIGESELNVTDFE